MQGAQYSEKADEIQSYADSYDTMHFYDTLKTVYRPQPSAPPPLLTADGNQLLTEKKQILERWLYIDQVLSRPAQIDEEAIIGDQKGP